MNTFEIGTYAWANIVKDQMEKFLIIGSNSKGMRVLLIPTKNDSSLYGGWHFCENWDLEKFNIEPFYLGDKIVYKNIEDLGYLGKQCYNCKAQFDHLPSKYSFICWRCTL